MEKKPPALAEMREAPAQEKEAAKWSAPKFTVAQPSEQPREQKAPIDECRAFSNVVRCSDMGTFFAL